MNLELIGHYAYSLAGHDKGTCYIIMEAEQDMVYLADGKRKGIQSPKKKKRKHIQPTNEEYTGSMDDASIRKAIKEYLNH